MRVRFSRSFRGRGRVHLDTVLVFSLSSIGWRRGPGRGGALVRMAVGSIAPLPGPLPTRSSRGEGVGASGLRTVSRCTRRGQACGKNFPLSAIIACRRPCVCPVLKGTVPRCPSLLGEPTVRKTPGIGSRGLFHVFPRFIRNFFETGRWHRCCLLWFTSGCSRQSMEHERNTK